MNDRKKCRFIGCEATNAREINSISILLCRYNALRVRSQAVGTAGGYDLCLIMRSGIELPKITSLKA